MQDPIQILVLLVLLQLLCSDGVWNSMRESAVLRWAVGVMLCHAGNLQLCQTFSHSEAETRAKVEAR